MKKNEKLIDILEKNRPEYKEQACFLDEIFSTNFSKKMDNENDDVNLLASIFEIEVGYHLCQIFDSNNVTYEPKIDNKTPDWLVEVNNQKIIVEVKLLNPTEEEIKNRIEKVKNHQYRGSDKTSYVFSNDMFDKHLYKLIEKEKKYHLLIEKGYVLLVYFSTVPLQDLFITDRDIPDLFDFRLFQKYKHSEIYSRYEMFASNIAGVIGKPIFGKSVFVNNETSKHPLNKENSQLFKNYFEDEYQQ